MLNQIVSQAIHSRPGGGRSGVRKHSAVFTGKIRADLKKMRPDQIRVVQEPGGRRSRTVAQPHCLDEIGVRGLDQPLALPQAEPGFAGVRVQGCVFGAGLRDIVR